MQTLAFYTLTLGFLFGVAMATIYPLTMVWAVWLLVLTIGLLLLWKKYTQTVKEERGKKLWLFAPLLLTAIAVGVVRFNYTIDQAPVTSYQNPAVITGYVFRDPEVREKTTHVYLRTTNESLLIITDKESVVKYGDRLRVRGDVVVPEPFMTDLGRLFRYDGYLKARGVYHVMFFPESITPERGDEGTAFIAALLTAKHKFKTALEEVLPPSSAALAEGLLLGEKRALGESNEDIFRRAGIIHIVVLSGYNVMLVVTFVMYLLSFFLPPRGRFMVGTISIMAFVLLVGASATVVRAGIMSFLVLLASALARHYAVWRALILAAVVMVIINPYILVYDPGFQLSFIATAGLVSVMPHFGKSLSSGAFPFRAKELLYTTLVAQLAVLPLLLYQIGEFSIVAVVVNILVLPVVPAAMLLSFLTGISTLVWSPVGELLALPTHWSLQYIYIVAELFGRQSFAAVTVPPFPFFFVVAIYGGMIFVGLKFLQRTHSTTDSSAPRKKAPIRQHETPIFFR